MKFYRTGIASILMVLASLTMPALAAPPALPDLPIPQSFGVNIHFLDKDLPQHMAYLKKAGIGWIRQDFFWDAVERRPGIYDFAPFDRLVAAAEDANIRVLFILDYGNSLYDNGSSPVSSEARAACARFAAAAARHYQDKNVVWEIYNEPNGGFWRPEPNVDQYIALADEVTAAIRQAVPHAVIMGPALAGPTLDPKNEPAAEEFLGKVLKSQAAHEWSAITVHPYRGGENSAPETIAPQLKHIREMMRDSGLDPEKTPIVAGEWGYSTWLRGVDEDTQAAYAVREFLWAAVEHMPFTIWYDWQDDGPNGLDREYRFGLLRAGALQEENEEDAVKPAFAAVRQVAELLRGYRFGKIIENNPSYTLLSFDEKGSPAYAVWTADAARDIDMTLPAGSWTATRLLGNDNNLVSTAGHKVILSADRMPTIIRKTGQGRME